MKEYNFTANRKYTLFDFVRFGFLFQPVYAFLLVLLQIIQAVLPSLQVFITADFVDTAIAVLRGQQLMCPPSSRQAKKQKEYVN